MILVKQFSLLKTLNKKSGSVKNMVSFNFKAKFNGDSQYLSSSSGIINVTPQKGTILLSTNIPFIEQNTPFEIIVTAVNQSGVAVSGLSVDYSFKIDGVQSVTGSCITNTEGKGTISETLTTEGDVELTLTVDETTNYNSATLVKEFRMGLRSTFLTISTSSTSFQMGEKIVVSGYLHDEDGLPVQNAAITLDYGLNSSFSSHTGTTTNSQGLWSVSLSNLSIGQYTLKASYAGNELYKSSQSSSRTISVTKKNTILEVINTSLIRGQSWFVRLKDSSGNRLGNKNIVFTANGVEYTRQTDSNGVASLAINILPNIYTFKAVFKGDTTYNASNTLNSSVVVNNYASVTKAATNFWGYGSSGVPYRSWSQLGSSSNGYVSICGSSSYPIGSSSGSYNTPQSLAANGFGFNIPSEATIKNITVIWEDANYPTTDSLGAHNSISCAVSSQQVQVINLGHGNTNAVNDGITPGQKIFKQHSVLFENVNALPSAVNDGGIAIILKWGKNTTGNVGRLKVQNVALKVEYTPYQERPI